MKKSLFEKIFLFFMLLVSSYAFGQGTVKGVVKGDDGVELIGVSISVLGTDLGSISDENGFYSISDIPSGKVRLEYTYIGYETSIESLDIENEKTLNVDIILLTGSKKLDDVIVVGYGTLKKSDKTGAVTFVKAEELNVGRLSDPIEALQGKAAGVTVSKQGGDPNSGFSVNIRGASGFTSGSGPLYVVDGVPGVDPTTISPQDIESYNILKDASSTAIYGARGSNGVIIITTKNGFNNKQKQKSIEYTGMVSMDKVARQLDFLDAKQIKDFATKTGANYIDNGGNVNWMDEIYRQGLTTEHNLSFNSSDDDLNYRASLGYLDIVGVLKGSSKTRSIARLNFTQKGLNNKLTLNGRLSGTIEKNKYVNYGGGINPTNVIYQAMRRVPTDPVYNSDGSYFETDRSFQYFNPVAIIDLIQNERDAKRFLANMSANYEIIKGLDAMVNVSYLRDDDESYYFEPSYAVFTTTKGIGSRSYNNKYSKLIETTLSYKKSFKEIHNMTLMGGHSYQKDGFDGFGATGRNALSDYVKSHNLGAFVETPYGSIYSYKNEYLLASFFGRAMYDFNKKYFFTATIRRDGSSKFGQNNEWGWFPSASLGWNLLEESFLKGLKNVDQLKLRIGYGISGNQDIPVNVDKITYLPAGTAINPENGQTVISFENAGGINPNPDLKWEENHELNVGIDFGIFKNKLSGSIEFYQKKTKDLIYNYELPVPPNKNRYIYANAGEIENKGFEATLQGFPISRKKWSWKSLLTFSMNRQNTTKLGNDKYSLNEIRTLYVTGRGLIGGENYSQIVRPGDELGTFYLPEFVRLSEDGKFLFKTASGGVTRDVASAARTVVGHAQPRFTIGWSNFFTIGKNFDFSLALRAVVGFDVLNVTKMVFSNPADLPTLNVLEEALTEYDKGLKSSPTLSNYYLENGTFLKIDNASVGYNLPLKNTKYLKALRFSVTGTNLYMFTGYTGLDPELSYGGIAFGRDQYDVYPKTRTLTFAVNARF
ncbi:MAG: SusC/RagA family TonB-linked outer membrane protein [Saprospiraceae bacterium]|jgi:iron complex outermembrane receptor protein|nr:SusC/RagA family TonB-linked outer membrane protein [Saprospiraceae bacterium]